jgi:hypothetical protein
METKSADPQAPEIDERRREVALFRYGVIAELVQWEPHHRGLYALLAKKAEQTYTIPGSLRRHVAPETMRGWLRDYRRGGFDALAPRVRADQGSSRSIPMHVVDLLCQLKEDTPTLSIPALLKVARGQHAAIVTDEVKLPESTVHRLLARRGLMKKRPEDPTSKDRRRLRSASVSHDACPASWPESDAPDREITPVASRWSVRPGPWKSVGDNTPAPPKTRYRDGAAIARQRRISARLILWKK